MKDYPIHERFYSEWNAGEPSPAALKEEALKWRDALLRSEFGDEMHRIRIAENLDACEPGNRCHSAACPMCGMAAKHLLSHQVDVLWPQSVFLKSYTLVSPFFQRPLGNLDSVDFESIREFALHWLQAAGFGDLKAFGFIDLCHSIDCRTGCEEFTPHIHMLTPVKGSEGLTPALASALESKGRVPVPVRGVVVRDRNRQISYVFKPRPQRAVRYATYGANARPTKHWLKRLQLVEALLWLGQYKALDRSIPINLDLLLPPGKSALRLTASRRGDIGRKWGATQL